MMTNMPVNRPTQFPIQNVTHTTSKPGREGIPATVTANLDEPTYTAEEAGFGAGS